MTVEEFIKKSKEMNNSDEQIEAILEEAKALISYKPNATEKDLEILLDILPPPIEQPDY